MNKNFRCLATMLKNIIEIVMSNCYSVYKDLTNISMLFYEFFVMLGKSLSMEYLKLKIQTMSLRKKEILWLIWKIYLILKLIKIFFNQRKEEQNDMKKKEKWNCGICKKGIHHQNVVFVVTLVVVMIFMKHVVIVL